jgi:hypothetical protein
MSRLQCQVAETARGDSYIPVFDVVKLARQWTVRSCLKVEDGNLNVIRRHRHTLRTGRYRAVAPKVGITAPCGAVGLPRWALIGTRGERERCYYHREALVENIAFIFIMKYK